MRNLWLAMTMICTMRTWGAPTLLQDGAWMDQVSQTSDSQSITCSEGSLLVVIVGLSNAGTNVTVSAPGLDFQEDLMGSPFDVRLEIWSAPNVSAGSHTITVTCAQSEFIRWGVAEFSGVATSSHVVDTSTGSGVTSTVSAGSVDVSATDTLLVAAVRTDGDDTAHGDISAGSNFTLVWPFSTDEPNQKLMMEYRVVSSSGTYSDGFSMENGDGGGWIAGMVAYSPTGAGGGNVTTDTLNVQNLIIGQ